MRNSPILVLYLFCGRGGKYSIDLFSVCIISSDFG